MRALIAFPFILLVSAAAFAGQPELKIDCTFDNPNSREVPRAIILLGNPSHASWKVREGYTFRGSFFQDASEPREFPANAVLERSSELMSFVSAEQELAITIELGSERAGEGRDDGDFVYDAYLGEGEFWKRDGFPKGACVSASSLRQEAGLY